MALGRARERIAHGGPRLDPAVLALLEGARRGASYPERRFLRLRFSSPSSRMTRFVSATPIGW